MDATIGAAVGALVAVTLEMAIPIGVAALPRFTGAGPAALPVCPAIAPMAITNAMPIVAMTGLALVIPDAPLDAHARGVSVFAGWSSARPSVS
jgi:hypothetical protein